MIPINFIGASLSFKDRLWIQSKKNKDLVKNNSGTPTSMPTAFFVFIIFTILLPGCKSPFSDKSSFREASESENKVIITPSFFPITGPKDIIFQNRTITRNYYFGGEALNQSLFESSSDQTSQANWLHFGIWGSMRVGESLDGTDIQSVYAAKDFAFESLEQTLNWLPRPMRDTYVNGLHNEKTTINTLTKIVQESLGAGNRRVADEIMGITDKYIKALGCDPSLDEKKLNEFLDSLEYDLDRNASFDQIWQNLLADIPNLSLGKMHQHGQDSLAKAYETYHRAKFETNPSVRAQMMHYGNLLIAIHEQYVLQTYISGALGILDPAGSLFRKVATILSMDIGVPSPGFTGVSRIGEGLTRTPLRTGFPAKGFASSLKNYTWEPLVELARVTGLNQNSGRGATDWTDYKSRIYLIGGMMRTFHHYPLIKAYPYSGPHQNVNVICPSM